MGERPSQQGPGGVGHGRLLEAGAGHGQVDLGGREISVAQEALQLGQRGPVVDQEGGVGVAQGVGQRSRWGSDPRPSEPGRDQVVEGPPGEGPTVGAHEQLAGGPVGPEPLPRLVR